MASPDHTPLGRGFDNSLIFFAGAQDHWSNCNCVDPTCAAPNNGFISGHNRSAGAHCWRTIADPLTQVVDSLNFAPLERIPTHKSERIKWQEPAPWPSTSLEMTGEGFTDLWATKEGREGPALGRNNTLYSGHLWTGEAISAIR